VQPQDMGYTGSYRPLLIVVSLSLRFSYINIRSEVTTGQILDIVIVRSSPNCSLLSETDARACSLCLF
jgi:hypothetical protein